METLIKLLPGLFLGIALSAGSGFRIFVPFLISNLAAKFGFISLSSNFEWMAYSSTTVVLVIASLVEIASYYITYIDNFLDSLALPSSVVAGTLLTTQLLKIEDPMLKWALGLLAGGGAAGTIQAGTSLLRLGSTKFTGGLGNGIFSTIENILSMGISLCAVWLPIIMGLLAIVFVIFCIKKIRQKFSSSSS